MPLHRITYTAHTPTGQPVAGNVRLPAATATVATKIAESWLRLRGLSRYEIAVHR